MLSFHKEVVYTNYVQLLCNHHGQTIHKKYYVEAMYCTPAQHLQYNNIIHTLYLRHNKYICYHNTVGS